MKKVLFVATVVGHINAFHIPYLKWFKEQGWETHVAAHADTEKESRISCCDVFHEVGFTRTPFTLKNIKAYKVLKQLINDNSFDIIHCHTPAGAALTRLAARQARSRGRTKVIYTAHGFHFYKGAPLLNWLVYYPIEKFLSRYTDVLITINKEDYEIAKNKMHAKTTEYIPGVGIDVKKIQNIKVDRNKKRHELEIPEDAIVLLSVGELSKRKNHEIVIKALSQLEDKNVVYAICGKGSMQEYLQDLACQLNVRDRVFLLGYRTDIIEICKASDIFLFPSLQEGLPVALMEAMACGLPVVCSQIRGNIDLITNGVNGYLWNVTDSAELCKVIVNIKQSINFCKQCAHHNVEIAKRFDIRQSLSAMGRIYIEIEKNK